MASTPQTNEGILYQPDEKPSHLTSLVQGFQHSIGFIGAMTATVAIVAVSGGQSEDYLRWIFFSSLAVCGVGRILQTFRFWRFGSGYPISVSTGSAFIAVCITALSGGGPAMLATLMAVSAVTQFIFISKLSLLRRIITPTVAGTVLMLVSATVISAVLVRLTDLPEGSPVAAAPVMAGATMAILVGMRLFSPPAWQQWGPIIALGVGCAIAIAWGLYEFQSALDAPWVGIPTSPQLGFDLGFGATFWALLPGFVIVIMATTIRSISDTVAVQQIAWRRPRATDFRVVQGAHNVVALTNILAAFVGALPNAVGGANSARIILTGVAARRVGVYAGFVLIAIAILPKLTALVTAIPRPVLVAYLVFTLSLLFAQGMRIVVNDGMDGRKATVVGVSLWLAIGFQNQLIFPNLLTGTLQTLLGNGMTIGSVCVVALTALMGLTSLRRGRLNVEMNLSALPEIDRFLRDFAERSGWNDASADRLRAAGEETLLSLSNHDDAVEGAAAKRLAVNARSVDASIELEFISITEADNIEDRLAYLADEPETHDDRDISFRLLRHYASSVQHRKYHDVDIVTVRVDSVR